MKAKIANLGIDGADATETLAVGGVHVGSLGTVEIFDAKDFMGKIHMTNTLDTACVWKTKDFGNGSVFFGSRSNDLED